MPSKKSRKITAGQLGDLLQLEWEKGNICNEVRDLIIEKGVLPVQYLKDQLQWVIERDGDGLKLTYNTADIPVENDNASNNVGYKPIDNRDRFRNAS